jgi:hypothetical protein
MPHDIETDVQIVTLQPDVQIIPIKPTEPQFPSASVPVLIIELGRTTNTTQPLSVPPGAEWIVEQAAKAPDESKDEEASVEKIALSSRLRLLRVMREMCGFI